MKKLLAISLSTLLMMHVVASCKGTSTVGSNTEQLVYTNGVYIAFNPHVSAFYKTGDSTIAVQGINIIRFTSQGKAIIIPESLDATAVLDSTKIRSLYNWCLEYETKNPKDKDYVHIEPRFNHDSITFSQKAPDSETVYAGINYKDSLKLVYHLIYGGKVIPTIKPKELQFRFYKLN